jgi:RNA polymerase sigma factor (sigma-70 family)
MPDVPVLPFPVGGAPTRNDADLALVQRALDGHPASRQQLVLRLTPVVHQRVTRPLSHFRMSSGRGIDRSDVLDLVQQVLLVLFDRDGRVLRCWDPERGLSLFNFVGLVAEREAKAILRSGRRSAWAEEPTPDDDLYTVAVDGSSLEDEIVSRQELLRLWQELEGELSPRSLALFRALVIEELSVEEVSAQFAMSANALYTFRSRIRQQIQSIRSRLSESAESTGTARVEPEPLHATRGADVMRRGRRSLGGES